MGSLDGRVALVTGASRGIGAAIAERLAAEGARVALTARTLDSHPTLPGTLALQVETIAARGGEALAIQGDMLEAGDRTRAVEQTRAAFGPIDVLVNNAAASFYIPFEQMSEKRYRIAFELNVRAPWHLAQLVAPEMRAAGRGAILNISSDTAKHPKGPPYNEFYANAGPTVYGATKAALDRISTGLAGELHAAGIAVNSLAPVAAVMTPGVEALGVVPEEFGASAEPVEAMAEAALALCEPRDPLLTGRVLYSLPLLEELGREIRSLDGRKSLSRA